MSPSRTVAYSLTLLRAVVQVYHVNCSGLRQHLGATYGVPAGGVWKRFSSFEALANALSHAGNARTVSRLFQSLLVGPAGIIKNFLSTSAEDREPLLQTWLDALQLAMERSPADQVMRRTVGNCFNTPDWP